MPRKGRDRSEGDPPLTKPPSRPTQVRRAVFLLACATSWLLYLHRYSWGVLKPTIKKETGLNNTELGWLDSAFQLTYALGQVPGGLAGDLLGARLVLPLLIVLWSAAAVAVIWTGDFQRLFAVRAAFGLAQAGAYPVLSKTSRNWFPLADRTALQGWVAAMGRIGAACCPLILATLLMGRLGLSWQTALWLLTAPGLVLAAAFWLVVRNSPAEHPRANSAERNLIQGGSPPALAARSRLVLLSDPLALLSLAMLLLYAFASTFQDQLYVNWIPLFLTDRGLDAESMGLFAPLPLLGGAVGSILGGMLNDALLKGGWSRRWVRSGVALVGKTIAAGLVVVSVHVGSAEMAMVVLLAARVFGDWSLATQWGAITDMGGKASGTVFGLVNTLGAIGGMVAGPVLGSLQDHHGWTGLFFGVAGMNLLAALTWLFIDCTRRVAPE